MSNTPLVAVDRASLVAHNLEKWEQIDQLQRAAAASERDGIQQAYAEQGIVWVQDQDTIERLTLQLAASEQRAAAAESENARTQEWLEKFQSEASTQQVRAIKAEQRAAALVEAGNVLAEYVGHQPFSLAKLTAIEAWRKALAAAAPSAGAEGA